MYIVYLHTNKITGKSYVGITKTSMEKRWKRHISLSKKNTSAHVLFGNAIRKHGSGDDVWEHLTLATYETLHDAFAAEKRYISELKTLMPDGYNMTLGGEGRFGPLSEAAKDKLRSVANTPEQRLKNSEAQKQHWEDHPERRLERAEVTRSIMARPGMKEKVSLRTKESMQSPEVKEKVNARFTDSYRDDIKARTIESWKNEETREKHREAEKRLLLSGKKGNKRVSQIDPETNTVIRTFLSICSASRESGVSKSSLQACLKGTLRHAGGFLWKLVDE